MIVYSAMIGWCIGDGIEKSVSTLGLTIEQRGAMAKKQAAFVIISTKYVLLLFPSLLVASCSYSILTQRDLLIIFIYCYASTALLQKVVQWGFSRGLNWYKDSQ